MTTLVVPTDAPSVVGPPQGGWTYADWESLVDDGRRYEIIAGVLYMTTAPSSFHQWIIQGLHEFIGIPMRRRSLGYALAAPVGLIMPGCDPVQPDFVIILQAHASIIRNRRIMGVPDAIIEVLSPGNAAYDTEIKRQAYAVAGVPEYGIIDPGKRRFSHYQLSAPGDYAVPVIVDASATVTLNCLPDLVIPIGELFAGAPDTSL